MSSYSGFIYRRADDDITDYLNVVHEPCGQFVARVEPGDDLSVLLSTVHGHLPRCVADRPVRTSTQEQRARLRRAVLGD